MADKTPISQDPPENKSEVQNAEEKPVTDIPENKDKNAAPATGNIAVVKSKIREKGVVQMPQVDSEDNMIENPKSSAGKVNRAQRRGKKAKAKSSETFDTPEPEGDELKTEMASDPQQQLNDDSELSVKLSSVSKKSTIKLQSLNKSSKKPQQLDNQEDSEEKSSESQSKGKNHLADASLSTFVISHDVEQTKEENVPSDVPEMQDEALTRTVPQRHIHERGNYMNNVSPSPIEEYSSDNEGEGQKKN